MPVGGSEKRDTVLTEISNQFKNSLNIDNLVG